MKPYIALVDDDAITNTLHKIILRKINPELTIKTFENPEAALNFFIETKEALPDLIFLDLNMPILSGWDFLDAFEKSDLHSPIVIVTSSIENEDKIRACSFKEVVNFITKPLEAKEIPHNILEIISLSVK